MRDQDQILKDRESEVLDRFRANLDRGHLSPHFKTRPLDHEWVDRDHLLVHLNDVEQITEMEIRSLQEALVVQSSWTIVPQHLNRMRISFLCQLATRPPRDPTR